MATIVNHCLHGSRSSKKRVTFRNTIGPAPKYLDELQFEMFVSFKIVQLATPHTSESQYLSVAWALASPNYLIMTVIPGTLSEFGLKKHAPLKLGSQRLAAPFVQRTASASNLI